MAGERWSFLERTLPGVAANLAIDELLLQHAEDENGPPALRLWELPTYAVVLGASGRWRDEIDVEACAADGVPIARRSSGGGTVVIGPGALNVAVVLPVNYAPGLGAVDVAQHFVLDRIAQSLRLLGPPVEVHGSGDLTLGLRKFSGSAQRRLKRFFLVHATILYAFDLPRIGRYLRAPARQPAYRAGRSHEEFVTNLELPRDAIVAAVRDAWLPPGIEPVEPVVPMPEIEHLVASKLGDPARVERL